MGRLGRWAGAIALALGAAAAALGAGARVLSVQVREGHLRASPSFLAAVVATAAYGDRLEVRGEQGAWTRAALPGGAEGWIHGSALTEKRVALRAGDAPRAEAASSREVALAGKGFNAQVEGEFKARHRDADFAWVDRLEGMGVAPAQLARFLAEGEVRPEGGGR